ATERRSTIGAAAPAGPTYRRARRPLRALRHEHAFGAATGVRRLSADALWWLALAERRPGARARPGALRPARRRPRRRALKPAPASCRERAGCVQHLAGSPVKAKAFLRARRTRLERTSGSRHGASA